MAEALLGEHYRHFKGGEYTVIAVAQDAGDNAVRYVIYQDIATHRIWARRKEEWEGAHSSGVERFSLIR